MPSLRDTPSYQWVGDDPGPERKSKNPRSFAVEMLSAPPPIEVTRRGVCGQLTSRSGHCWYRPRPIAVMATHVMRLSANIGSHVAIVPRYLTLFINFTKVTKTREAEGMVEGGLHPHRQFRQSGSRS